MASATMMGRLQAILGLDTRGFERGLDGARGRVGTFSREIGIMAASMAAALTAGIGAIGGVTASAISAANEVSRLSQVANTTPEIFQRWSAGAETVGIEQEKMADILKDVNDRVGDFLSTGGGPMADFFQNIAPKVGVTADQFRRLSGPEALQLYVDSLQKAGANQQQMTFYLEAMASDATLLLPLLRNGGAEMNRLGAAAAGMGAVLSGGTIAAMRQTQVAMTQIGQAATGIRNQIAAAALPYVQRLAAVMVAAASEGGILNRAIQVIMGNLDRIGAYAATAAVTIGTYLAGGFVAARIGALTLTVALRGVWVALLRLGLPALILALGEIVLRFSRLVEASGSFRAALVRLQESASIAFSGMVQAGIYLERSLAAVSASIEVSFLKAFRRTLQAFQDMINKMIDGWNSMSALEFKPLGINLTNADIFGAVEHVDLGETLGGVDDASEEAAKRQIEAEEAAAEAYAEAAKRAGEAWAKLHDSAFPGKEKDDLLITPENTQTLTEFGTAATGAAGKASKASEVMKRLREEYAKATETFGMTDAQVAAWEAMREAKVTPTSATGKEITSLTESIDSMKRLREATDGVSQSAKGAFSGILNGAQTLQEGLAGVLNNIANMLINAGLSSIWSSLGGTGIGKSLGGLFSSLIGANANGTENWEGGLTWVGERGRELVDLPRGSRVISNERSEQIARGAGPASMTVEVNPSPYFNAVVDQRAAGVAAPMVRDSAQAQRLSYAQMQNHLDQRGTMT